MLRRRLYSILMLLLALAPAAGNAAPAAEPGPAHALAVEVRSAPLADVVAQMAAASDSRMAVEPDLGDARVTLYAPRTNAGEFRHAVATLLGARWRTEGAPEKPHLTLERNPTFAARVAALGRRRDAQFLRRLLETANAMAAGAEEETARQVRDEFQRRHPEMDPEALKDLNADFLRQALLATPLTPTLQAQLTRAGWVSVPFAWLSPAHQELLARFAAQGGLRATLGLAPAAADVTLPSSRVTYRLLYGDRWTDTVLWIQVGSPEGWATAILPSILFRREDGADAYSAAAERPNDPDVWRSTPGRFDIAGKSWDRIVADLGAAMHLKIASDASLRPPVFEPNVKPRPIAGLPLRLALDRLAQDRGLFWWKEGDWYYFRSRTWLEERRVALPDHLLLAWTRDIRQTGRLTAADLDAIGGLSEEQLITLNLMARAPQQPAPHLAAFDPNSASLAATSLLMFRSLTPVQREQALSADGLPALWLSPSQQNLFSAVAAEHGYLLDPDEADAWGYAVEQAWNAPPAAQPVTGRLRLRWSFGPGLEEAAELFVSDALLNQASGARRQ